MDIFNFLHINELIIENYVADEKILIPFILKLANQKIIEMSLENCLGKNKNLFLITNLTNLLYLTINNNVLVELKMGIINSQIKSLKIINNNRCSKEQFESLIDIINKTKTLKCITHPSMEMYSSAEYQKAIYNSNLEYISSTDLDSKFINDNLIFNKFTNYNYSNPYLIRFISTSRGKYYQNNDYGQNDYLKKKTKYHQREIELGLGEWEGFDNHFKIVNQHNDSIVSALLNIQNKKNISLLVYYYDIKYILEQKDINIKKLILLGDNNLEDFFTK